MMKTNDWLLAGLECISWYLFLYILIYSIKYPVAIWQNAFVLLALMYIAVISCPLIRFSDSWKRMWQNY